MPVSEQQVLASSGMSEKALLEELYHILNRDALKLSPHLKPLLEEVERRLGLGKPVTKNLPRFQEQHASDVRGAVVLLLDGALPATPVLTKARVEVEYQDMVRAWGCQELVSGTAQEIADKLQRSLESDLASPSFADFSVEVITDQYCAQLYSNNRAVPGRGYRTAKAYRLWRTADSIFLCGGGQAIF